MDLGIKGKTALVLGASQGLGEADPTEIAGLRQTRVAAHVGPSVAAIGGFPDSAVGPADPDLPAAGYGGPAAIDRG